MTRLYGKLEEKIERGCPMPGQTNITDGAVDYYYSGSMDCKPGHEHGPALRDHYLIHYIHHGKGIFETEGKTHFLSKHNGFLVSPGVRFYYMADEEEPWQYSWVAFKGERVEHFLQSAGLSRQNPVFRYDLDEQLTDCLTQINITKKNSSAGVQVKLTGLIYIFLSLLISSAQREVTLSRPAGANKKELYVDQALDFIYKNYSRNIKIQDIARHLNIDRRYLSSLFNRQLGSTPHDMLIHFRMRKACELMTDRSLSVSDIARSVGYGDPLQFSKIFKKHQNMSPTKFRERLQSTEY